MNAQVQWLTPSPLWSGLSAATDLTAYRRPAILRFATDTFMPVLQGVLQQNPPTLGDYVAQGETWQFPAAGLGSTSSLPLKLFQPVQARFYVIASSLTCRMPGLPDHTVNTNLGENVVFVVRQLRPKAGYTAAECNVYDPAVCTEYAWIPVPGVSGAPGAIGDQPEWFQVPAITAASPCPSLVTGEQQLPLAPAQAGSNGSARRIFTGLIPASRREQYISARTTTVTNASGNGSSAGSTSAAAAQDPRADMFNREVATPWCLLNDWWNGLDIATIKTNNQLVEYQQAAQQSSALILADFASFLIAWIPHVWTAIEAQSASGLTTPEAALYNTLGAPLQAALQNAYSLDPQLEAALPGAALPSGYSGYSIPVQGSGIDASTTLLPAVTAALPPASAATQPLPAPQPVPQKPSNPQGNYYFIVRCVYLRPQCLCNVISPPSQPFLLASYYDPDAPARRIQVALPLDTTAAGFRKFDKGVSFLMSDELRNQLSRVPSLQALTNGAIGNAGDSLGIGWICSFSIPIITICAMILLLVIVIALNLVFFWLPFFRICLPVPSFQGKGD